MFDTIIDPIANRHDRVSIATEKKTTNFVERSALDIFRGDKRI
jgi:hypothetical protein